MLSAPNDGTMGYISAYTHAARYGLSRSSATRMNFATEPAF